jgi:hypothetical protein
VVTPVDSCAGNLDGCAANLDLRGVLLSIEQPLHVAAVLLQTTLLPGSCARDRLMWALISTASSAAAQL